MTSQELSALEHIIVYTKDQEAYLYAIGVLGHHCKIHYAQIFIIRRLWVRGNNNIDTLLNEWETGLKDYDDPEFINLVNKLITDVRTKLPESSNL